MDRNIVIRVTAPAVLIGLLLLAACVASAGYINHLHSSLTRVLEKNVTSRVQTRIIPDKTDCPCLIAHGDTGEVVHRETVIAGNKRAIH